MTINIIHHTYTYLSYNTCNKHVIPMYVFGVNWGTRSANDEVSMVYRTTCICIYYPFVTFNISCSIVVSISISLGLLAHHISIYIYLYLYIIMIYHRVLPPISDIFIYYRVWISYHMYSNISHLGSYHIPQEYVVSKYGYINVTICFNLFGLDYLIIDRAHPPNSPKYVNISLHLITHLTCRKWMWNVC